MRFEDDDIVCVNGLIGRFGFIHKLIHLIYSPFRYAYYFEAELYIIKIENGSNKSNNG